MGVRLETKSGASGNSNAGTVPAWSCRRRPGSGCDGSDDFLIQIHGVAGIPIGARAALSGPSSHESSFKLDLPRRKRTAECDDRIIFQSAMKIFDSLSERCK